MPGGTARAGELSSLLPRRERRLTARWLSTLTIISTSPIPTRGAKHSSSRLAVWGNLAKQRKQEQKRIRLTRFLCGRLVLSSGREYREFPNPAVFVLGCHCTGDLCLSWLSAFARCHLPAANYPCITRRTGSSHRYLADLGLQREIRHQRKA